jgi:hypothetical protein
MPKFDDDRGHFYVNLGYAKEGSRSQPKFNLGTDARDATIRLARLEAVWEAVKADGIAFWTATELAIARAVGRGDESVRLPPPPPDFASGESLIHWTNRHRE